LAALDTAGPLRAGTAEERVGDGSARLQVAAGAEEDADRRRVVRIALAELLREPLHLEVAGRGRRVLDHAAHPLGVVEARGERVLPVGDVRPLRIVVERLR